MSQITGRIAIAPAGRSVGRRMVMFATVAVAVALALLAGVAWSRLVSTLRHAEPVTAPQRPPVNAVVWGNRVFTNRRSLARWLAARDERYSVWGRRHPSAAHLLKTPAR